jgi:hypothetical protein
MSIVLTNDQQAAYEEFTKFLLDPAEQVFVLAGYSGTGKTTLVKTLLERLPLVFKTAKLIDPKATEWPVVLTATTNKAGEAFSSITGQPVRTIHSFLGLRVNTDYKSGATTLSVRKGAEVQQNQLVFIDEASYIDKTLLKFVFSQTKNCKIVFMGDPAQLTPVKSSGVPVFTSGFRGAHLSEVVRQAKGNPIVELSTMFRETVNTGDFFSFKPDGTHIKYLPRAEFDAAITLDFTQPDWCYNTSKVLAWTNKCAISYNHAINNVLCGNPELKVGDYAICNRYMNLPGGNSIKTDQTVCITHLSADEEEHGVLGNQIILDDRIAVFLPKDRIAVKARIKKARDDNQLNLVAYMENNWIDLRAAFAMTINKAQGSTYRKVFIDLDDIKKCNSADQIARMLYVGVSRASHEVVLTGDLI